MIGFLVIDLDEVISGAPATPPPEFPPPYTPACFGQQPSRARMSRGPTAENHPWQGSLITRRDAIICAYQAFHKDV